MGETRNQNATIEPISVVMPVLNEEMYLAQSVEHILSQDYPGELELVLALGPSRDNTTEIARRIASTDPRVTVVDNPTGKISTAINAAVKAARHAVIARVDGHALIPPGYLRLAMATLSRTGAVNVGGVMAAEGIGPFQQAVAWAMTSKVGVGSATWHTGGEPAPADSAYLGIYQRQAINNAGGWDETMLRAEDWELNYRIRSQGGLVWCTPELQVTYRPRRTAKALASQYWHYGRWRRVVMREHPETASFRYLAPPGVAAAVTAGTLAGLAGLFTTPWLILGFAVPVVYLAGVTAGSVMLSANVKPSVRVRLPAVLAIMHLSWGAGFLLSPRGLHRAVLAGERSLARSPSGQ